MLVLRISALSTLRSAEARYLSPVMSFGVGPAEHASSEIAEGLRYVAHVTRLALELYTEVTVFRALRHAEAEDARRQPGRALLHLCSLRWP